MFTDTEVGSGGERVNPAVEACDGAGSRRVEGPRLVLKQVTALFIKRFHNVRRSKKGFVSEVRREFGEPFPTSRT